MSFYTALKFYRPTRPPIITGETLSQFVRSLRPLNITEDRSPLHLELKFGKAIDQDRFPTTWTQPITEIIGTAEGIEWDVSADLASSDALVEELKKHPQPIYRAFLSLGSVVDEISVTLTRHPSPENEIPLGLYSLDLELGPIDTFKLSSSRPRVVGWISVAISGNGYLYPWKLRDLVQRAEGSAKLQELMQVCRRTWPVKAERPGLITLLRRARMKDLWPYDTLSRRWDWYWSLGESG